MGSAAPNMAATSFRALILVFYFLLFCSEILSTWDPIDCHHHGPCQEALKVFPGAYFSHYGRFAVTGRPSIVFVTKRFGFHRAKIPSVSWTKHGCTVHVSQFFLWISSPCFKAKWTSEV